MEEQINEMNKFFQGISVSAVDMLWHIAAALGGFLLGGVVKKLLRKLLDRLMKPEEFLLYDRNKRNRYDPG